MKNIIKSLLYVSICIVVVFAIALITSSNKVPNGNDGASTLASFSAGAKTFVVIVLSVLIFPIILSLFNSFNPRAFLYMIPFVIILFIVGTVVFDSNNSVIDDLQVNFESYANKFMLLGVSLLLICSFIISLITKKIVLYIKSKK